MALDKNSSHEIDKAVELLKNNQVVGLPTETVYGLAGSIDSDVAIRRIFSLKERPFFDPLIVHVANFEDIGLIARNYKNDIIQNLATKFWPGPLTIILEKNELVNPLITSGLNSVAVRIPRHPIALEVIKRLGNPIAMPSANKFGKTSPTSAKHVSESFEGSGLVVIDGGESIVGLESTVVRVNTGDSQYSLDILRPGFITADDLKKELPFVSEIKIIESVASPGHVEHHYMPDKPLVLLPANTTQVESKYVDLASIQLKKKFIMPSILILDEDPVIAARELYSKLRSISATDTDIIFMPEPNSKEGLWQAIWDRIKRAKTISLS